MEISGTNLMSGRERDEAVRFSRPTVTVPAVGSSGG